MKKEDYKSMSDSDFSMLLEGYAESRKGDLSAMIHEAAVRIGVYGEMKKKFEDDGK